MGAIPIEMDEDNSVPVTRLSASTSPSSRRPHPLRLSERASIFDILEDIRREQLGLEPHPTDFHHPRPNGVLKRPSIVQV